MGVLDRDGDGETTSTYLPEYVSDGDVALSARLPIQAAPHAAARVRPYLAGLLPENAATRRAWAAQLGVDADDAFGILARMGWDCPGAVQFCREEDLHELRARAQQFERVKAAAEVRPRPDRREVAHGARQRTHDAHRQARHQSPAPSSTA